MADSTDFERAGKHLLLGLHRAGQTFAHAGGKLLDVLSFGQLDAADAIDQFTDSVGLAYAALDALPEDSPERQAVVAQREAEEQEERERAETAEARSRALYERLSAYYTNSGPLPFEPEPIRPAPRKKARRPESPPPPSPPANGRVESKKKDSGLDLAGLTGLIKQVMGGLS